MPKYLFQLSFTPDGLKGVREGGAASRVESGHAVAASLGGTMECYYFAFGDHDGYGIMDLPDDEAATAVSVTANASGALQVSVTKLLTAEQVDEAFTRTVDYSPPGQ